MEQRLAESFETALDLSGGTALVVPMEGDGEADVFSANSRQAAALFQPVPGETVRCHRIDTDPATLTSLLIYRVKRIKNQLLIMGRKALYNSLFDASR